MKLRDKDKKLIIILLCLLVFAGLCLFGAWRLYSSAPEPRPTPSPSPTATPEPTPKPTPTPEPTPTPIPELLLLVNPWNKLPEDYTPELVELEEEMYVDVRCYEALVQMLEDCRAAGNAPLVCSAYRTLEEQQYLFNNKMRRLVHDEGVSLEDAPEIAARSVAKPNTSEHQLGLAVDIIHYYFVKLTPDQEKTSTQRWLMEHCWDYGFILRYPNGSSDITGIIYEPWHYRFVGVEYAQEIKELGITLEEYLELSPTGVEPRLPVSG